MANPAKRIAVLFEPNESLRVDYAEALGRAGWQYEIVSSLREAAEREYGAAVRVVFLERETDEGSLLKCVGQIRRRHAGLPIVLKVDEVDEKVLVRWMRAGLRDVLRKPVEAAALVACAEHWGAPAEGGGAQEAAKDQPAATQVLSKAIQALVEVLEAKDKFFVGYTKAVMELSDRLAAALSLPEKLRQTLRLAALLHDIGRVGLRDEVVNKQGRLTAEEQAHIASHVVIGEQILVHLFSDKEILSLVRHHHEWYNGKGYPEGLSGEAIPLGARILAVADACVAMTQDRPHRARKSDKEALREICAQTGAQFCPQVVAALMGVMGLKPPAPAAEATAPSTAKNQTADKTPPVAEDDAADAPAEGKQVNSKDVLRRIKRVMDLRALPSVVTEVLAMTNQKDANLDELAAKIKCDHALTTKLLRLANSALYGSRTKVESIERAVVRTGIHRLRQVVLGVGVIDQWRAVDESSQFSLEAFWRHSVASAILASRLAAGAEGLDEQSAFTVGLLHDIGQLVLLEALRGDYSPVLGKARAEKLFLPAAEQAALGIDHASVMQTVGRDWGLPEHMIEVLASHHQPWQDIQKMEGPSLRLLLCVRLGSSLSHALGLGDGGLGAIEAVPEALGHFLGINKPVLNEALPVIRQQVSDLAQAYGLAPKAEEEATPQRKPPQRRGYYVCPARSALDPLPHFLGFEQADFETAGELKKWKAEADRAWCLIHVATPAFAKTVIGELQDVSGDAEQARRNLLLLLPTSSQEALQQLLSSAGIPCLIEPWNVGALREALQRMRSPAAQEPEPQLAAAKAE